MCNSTPQAAVTDPLANQKTWAADAAQGQYNFGLPYSRQFLSTIMPSLGNFNWNQPGATPQTLVNSDTALNDILSGGGSKVADAFSGLKQNLLGVYDTGVERYTLAPLREQLINEGIYSSGPGMDAYQNAATNAAQQRAAIGSGADVQMLDLMNQFINQGQSLGTQEFNIGQMLGLQNPIQAFQAFNSLQTPRFQDIATTPIQNNSGALGALLGLGLGGPAIQALPALLQAGRGAAPTTATPPTNPPMQNILGNLGSLGPSAGNAYNPAGPLNSQAPDIQNILNNPQLLMMLMQAAA